MDILLFHCIENVHTDRLRVIGEEVVSVGSLTSSIVHPREVFLPAVRASAGAVVLVHNHPSGDPRPSDEDVAVTRRLVHASELLGVKVVDHVGEQSRKVGGQAASRVRSWSVVGDR